MGEGGRKRGAVSGVDGVGVYGSEECECEGEVEVGGD